MIRDRLPQAPSPDAPLNIEWGRSVERWMRANTIVSVVNGRLSRGSQGTTIIIDPPTVQSSLQTQSLRPFDVRWYSKGTSGGSGEWQIYLPVGCMTLTQGETTVKYKPSMSAAKDREGKHIPAWYRIDVGDDDATIVPGDKVVYKEYPVYICMKPWARMRAGTSEDCFDAVEWTVPVARMLEVEYEDTDDVAHSSVRLYDADTIEKTWDISKPFSIKYEIEPDASDDAVDMTVVKQEIFLGRLQKILDEDTTVEGGWKSIFVRITHDTAEFDTEVTHDLSGTEAESDDDKTVFKIYDLKNRIVVADYRDTVPHFDLYTSASKSESGESDSPDDDSGG